MACSKQAGQGATWGEGQKTPIVKESRSVIEVIECQRWVQPAGLFPELYKVSQSRHIRSLRVGCSADIADRMKVSMPLIVRQADVGPLRSQRVVLKQLYEAFSAGNVDPLMSVIADDAYWIVPGRVLWLAYTWEG